MFGKKKDARVCVPSSPETRYQSARSSLLLVVVLTAINLLLLVMRSSTQFLFSASFPSYLYIIADEFADYLGMGTVLRLGALAVGVCDIGLYLLFWFLSGSARGCVTGWVDADRRCEGGARSKVSGADCGDDGLYHDRRAGSACAAREAAVTRNVIFSKGALTNARGMSIMLVTKAETGTSSPEKPPKRALGW